MGQLGIRRQCEDDLASELRVLTFLGEIRGVPQHRARGEFGRRTSRQQHLMVRRRIAMLEVKQLARTVRGDGDTLVIGGRANDVVAPTPGKKARTGELDGHAVYMNRQQSTSQVCVVQRCVLRLHACFASLSRCRAPRRGLFPRKLTLAESLFFALAQLRHFTYRRLPRQKRKSPTTHHELPLPNAASRSLIPADARILNVELNRRKGHHCAVTARLSLPVAI